MPRYAIDEYLARERISVGKREYYRGQIFAMAGGSLRHNTISVNLVVNLGGRLRGSSCRPCNSDQRIRIPANGLSTYPDVSVVCGEVQVDAEGPERVQGADSCIGISNAGLYFAAVRNLRECDIRAGGRIGDSSGNLKQGVCATWDQPFKKTNSHPFDREKNRLATAYGALDLVRRHLQSPTR